MRTCWLFAWRERQYFLTFDPTTLNDARFPEHRGPGIVVLPGGSGDYAASARVLPDCDVGVWFGTHTLGRRRK